MKQRSLLLVLAVLIVAGAGTRSVWAPGSIPCTGCPITYQLHVLVNGQQVVAGQVQATDEFSCSTEVLEVTLDPSEGGDLCNTGSTSLTLYYTINAQGSVPVTFGPGKGRTVYNGTSVDVTFEIQ